MKTDTERTKMYDCRNEAIASLLTQRLIGRGIAFGWSDGLPCRYGSLNDGRV